MGEWINKTDMDGEIPDYAKQDLEYDQRVDPAIVSAEIYVRAHLKSHGKYPPPDDWVETIKLIVKRLVVYELYARLEKEESVKDKRDDAHRLLRVLLKGEMEGEKDSKGLPVINVSPGSDDWRGYK